MKLLSAKNLSISQPLEEGEPWAFQPPKQLLDEIKGLKKSDRRVRMLSSKTEWDVYYACRGHNPAERISKANPCVGVRALVVDYDLKSTLEEVTGHLSQLKEELRPNYVEVSLSGKIRLVWKFSREVMTVSTGFAQEFMTTLGKQVQADILLAGFDAASFKAAQGWTNGGTWYQVREDPLSWEVLFGVITKVSKQDRFFEACQVPMTTIADEVKNRFPNRWQGPFELDQTGVRFWDKDADNTAGCQVKPDGMLCFTGPVPFMTWKEIFGASWVSEQEVLNIGRAASDIFTDGTRYFVINSDKGWEDITRTDCEMRLRNAGISATRARGRTNSDMDQVMEYIQTSNRVSGVGSLVNHPPGLVMVGNKKVLNTTTLTQPKLSTKLEAGPEDFPWIDYFLDNFFADDPDNPTRAKHYFLAWLRRSVSSFRTFTPEMGQAIFVAGPKDCGKTLLGIRIVAPLLGGNIANPYRYLIGETDFNDDLFEAYLWSIHDEEAPDQYRKSKMIAKLKSTVVNPIHTIHPKFCKKVSIVWCGRHFNTLNDDAHSIGMMSEPVESLMDKVMFFMAKPHPKPFLPMQELQALIAKELPFFARWLVDTYEPPVEVLKNDRMGVVSFFDPILLELSKQQGSAYNLAELLGVFFDSTSFFTPVDGTPTPEYWEGSPTKLMAEMSALDHLSNLLKEWNVSKMAKSLTALSRMTKTGVKSSLNPNERSFKIYKHINVQAPTSN